MIFFLWIEGKLFVTYQTFRLIWPNCYIVKFIPIFNLRTLTGCQFGMINVNKNKNIIRLSKQTISQITFVPYIILFINGKPFMRYDGPINKI